MRLGHTARGRAEAWTGRLRRATAALARWRASCGGACCAGAVARGKAWAQRRGEARARWRGREVAGAGSRWHGEARARRRAVGELWRHRRWRQGLGLGHGETKRRQRLNEDPKRDGEGNGEKRPKAARDPLTGRSGGSDRTLPPSVRSIPERSSSSGIGTGRVRWSMTGRRQGPVRVALTPLASTGR